MGKLRHWPDQLLVYHFRVGLNQELYHTCLPRGIPDWIRVWYQLATIMELNIKEYKRHGWGMKAGRKRSRSAPIGKETTACIDAAPPRRPRGANPACVSDVARKATKRLCAQHQPPRRLQKPQPHPSQENLKRKNERNHIWCTRSWRSLPLAAKGREL